MKKLMLLLLLLFLPLGALADTSASLTERRIDTPTGYRIEYVDAQGCVALATDKGYAAVERTVVDGHTTEEYFFDATGSPAKLSGTCGRAYLYEGEKCVQVTFLDDAHQPARNTSGYAIVKRTVDDAGHIVREMYFDETGEPAALWGGQYGMSRDAFDEKNRVIQYTYLDQEGEPFRLSSGYATVKRTYDAAGRTWQEMYFDTSGAPAMLSLGQAGQQYIRDEEGKHIGTIYLDESGAPMVNTQGYAIVRYTYDEQGNIVCYRYFGPDDQPVALSRGQYGQARVFEGKKLVRSYLIDADGRELFLLDQFLAQNPFLNLFVALLLVAFAVLLPKKPRVALLLSYVLFILYMTLLVREQGDPKHNFQLFWSYEQFFTSDSLRLEILHNILLFVPLGALAYSLWPHPLSLLAAVLLSVLVEATQLAFGLGLCELDDIVSNGLGSGIGWALACVGKKLCRKTK